MNMKTLKYMAYTEGVSLLLLLGVAMPLKYIWHWPAAVSIMGMLHGVLFIAYILLLALTSLRLSMPWWALPLGIVAAVLPFGPFIFDPFIQRHMATV